MAQINPPRPTPAKPETVRAPAAGETARWKGGGRVTDVQVAVVVLVAGSLFATVTIGMFWALTPAFVGIEDVTDSVTVGDWQGDALVLDVGQVPFETYSTATVAVLLTDADGLPYYAGAVGHTVTVNDVDVSVSYFDADGDGYVTQGDHITVAVTAPDENPLVGGAGLVSFWPEGFANLELP